MHCFLLQLGKDQLTHTGKDESFYITLYNLSILNIIVAFGLLQILLVSTIFVFNFLKCHGWGRGSTLSSALVIVSLHL